VSSLEIFRIELSAYSPSAESYTSMQQSRHLAMNTRNMAWEKTQWLESASELYRPSDRRLSAKLIPTFMDRRPRDQHDGSLRPNSRLSRPEPLLFLPSGSPIAEWTPFQTHYFSENLVAPGTEPRPLDLLPGTLTTRTLRRSGIWHVFSELQSTPVPVSQSSLCWTSVSRRVHWPGCSLETQCLLHTS
jgi:hypothetical protein